MDAMTEKTITGTLLTRQQAEDMLAEMAVRENVLIRLENVQVLGISFASTFFNGLKNFKVSGATDSERMLIGKILRRG